MKIHRAETVVRYHVTFLPHEAKTLDQHETLRHKIHVCPDRGGGVYSRGADAMLTRSDINDVCDALGVNGREFMAQYDGIETPSSVDVSLGIAGHRLDRPPRSESDPDAHGGQYLEPFDRGRR